MGSYAGVDRVCVNFPTNFCVCCVAVLLLQTWMQESIFPPKLPNDFGGCSLPVNLQYDANIFSPGYLNPEGYAMAMLNALTGYLNVTPARVPAPPDQVTTAFRRESWTAQSALLTATVSSFARLSSTPRRAPPPGPGTTPWPAWRVGRWTSSLASTRTLIGATTSETHLQHHHQSKTDSLANASFLKCSATEYVAIYASIFFLKE